MAINYLNSINLNKNELLQGVIENQPNDAAAGASPVEGQLYFNTTDHVLKQYNGTAWKEVGGGVETLTTTDSTYINLTPNSATAGAVTVTAALSAIDGTAVAATRFLSKDNTWDIPTVDNYGYWVLDADGNGDTANIKSGDTVDFVGGLKIGTNSTAGGTLNITHDLQAQTDLTSAVSPALGTTFTVVDSVARDTTGHVTGLNVKTITLPTTAVTQSSGDNSTKIATTAYADAAAAAVPIGDYVTLATAQTISGAKTFNNDVTLNNTYLLGVDKLEANQIVIGTSTSSILGNVGIGTSTVTNGKLVIEESGTSIGSTIRLIGTNTIAGASQVSHITSYQPSGGGAQEAALDFKVRRNTDAYASPSTVMTLLGSGNVGIGTANPTVKLQVYDDSSSQLKITNGLATPVDLQLFASSSSYAGIGTASNHRLALRTNNTEKVTILANGNVGIGTTSPAVRLDFGSSVNQAFHLYTSGVDYYGINMTQYDSGSYSTNVISGNGGQIKFRTASGTSTQTTRMTITAGGNVGIGTTAPGEKLEVAGNIRTNVGNGLGFMLTGSSASGLVRNAGTGLALRTNSIDKLVIDSTGSVAFSAYTGTNEQGTPTYLLGTDASGNVVKTLSSTAPGSLWAASGNDIYNTNSGNVGIGTTNPSAPLDIVSSATGGTTIELDNTSTGGRNWTLYSSGSGNSFGAGKFALYDADAASVRMLVDTSGNVGIGTTSPSAKLHVVGNTTITGVTYTDIVQTYSGASIDFRHQDASVVMRVDTANARVGIGTTSPTFPFSLESATTGLISRIYNSNANGQGLLIRAGATASATRVFQAASSNDTKIMTVNSNGNVGIGTANPSTKLEVISAANEEGIAIKDSSGNLKYKIRQFGGNSYSTFWDSTNTEKVRITSGGSSFFNGGNVGIGTTSPTHKLQVVGNGAFNSTLGVQDPDVSSNGLLQLSHDSTGSSIYSNPASSNTSTVVLRLGINNSEKIRIANNGNVGIGTTSPSAKLHVKASSGGQAYSILERQDYAKYASNLYYSEITTPNSTSPTWLAGIATSDYGYSIQSYNNVAFTTRLKITPDGNVGIGTTSPQSKLDVSGGDIEVKDIASGVIMKSPNGTRYRVTIANGGTLVVTAV